MSGGRNDKQRDALGCFFRILSGKPVSNTPITRNIYNPHKEPILNMCG